MEGRLNALLSIAIGKGNVCLIKKNSWLWFFLEYFFKKRSADLHQQSKSINDCEESSLTL